jgi:glycosyltransferase involved in cell wall biosynthesis
VKILFVCGAGLVYGKEIITLSLAEGLRERGHDVRCAISIWSSDGKYAEKLQGSSIPFVRLPLGFISKTMTRRALGMTFETLCQTPGLWLGYRRYLKEFQPDVVVHSTLHHVFHVWPLLNPRNTFFHVHDPFAQTKFYRRLFRLLSMRLRAFIGVSRYIEQSIINLGIAPEKVFSVLNGVTPESGVENGNPSRSRAELSNKSNGNGAPVKIGIVGQIGEWKGHDDFVESLKGLKKADLSFSAMIIGEGHPAYIAALKEKIEGYQLTEQVRWVAPLKTPREIFSKIDICVVPSRSQDPCPTVAIETAHFGVPIVATRRGGLPEIVQDGRTGYLVDAESPAQLAEKLKLLIQDIELRQQMSREAQSYGATYLTRERMAEQMEAVFMKTIGLKANN